MQAWDKSLACRSTPSTRATVAELTNGSAQVLLHRWTLKGECRAAAFSPDGDYIAMGIGKLLQV